MISQLQQFSDIIQQQGEKRRLDEQKLIAQCDALIKRLENNWPDWWTRSIKGAQISMLQITHSLDDDERPTAIREVKRSIIRSEVFPFLSAAAQCGLITIVEDE